MTPDSGHFFTALSLSHFLERRKQQHIPNKSHDNSLQSFMDEGQRFSTRVVANCQSYVGFMEEAQVWSRQKMTPSTPISGGQWALADLRAALGSFHTERQMGSKRSQHQGSFCVSGTVDVMKMNELAEKPCCNAPENPRCCFTCFALLAFWSFWRN